MAGPYSVVKELMPLVDHKYGVQSTYEQMFSQQDYPTR